MQISKVIQTATGQAFSIPNELQTSEKEFIITKTGNCYFLAPPSDPWAMVRQCMESSEEDISFDRNQPMLNELPPKDIS